MFRFLSFFLLVVSINLLATALNPAMGQDSPIIPSCEVPVGTWQNELGSVLVIESLDAATGQIAGEYRSAAGAGAKSFPLIGWANDADLAADDPKQTGKKNHAQVLAFTVRWGEIGSVTSWTGTCAVVNNVPAIKTVWNLARPNSDYSWDHINSGSATFVPISGQ